MMWSLSKKVIAVLLAVLTAYESVSLPLAEAASYKRPSNEDSNFWQERRRNIQQLALLPKVVPALEVLTAHPQLGDVQAGLSLPFTSATKTLKNLRKQNVNPSVVASLEAIPLPLGSVKEISGGSSQIPFVLLVQDVHLNAEAQHNIADILTCLRKRQNPRLANHPLAMDVGVEGAFGSFDFRSFRAFPDKRVVQEAADFLLRQNKIAAPSYVGLTIQDPPLFYGIDQEPDYIANVEAYREAQQRKVGIQKTLNQRRGELEEAKARVFNPRLAEFDALQKDFRLGQKGLGEYLSALIPLAAGQRVRLDPLLEQFLEAYRLEKSIDFSRVERERATVIEQLSKKSNPEELNWFINESLAYRLGRVSYADYYESVRSLMAKHSISPSQTPAFETYIRYIVLADGLNGDSLLNAVRNTEKNLLGALIKNPEEKNLVSRARLLDLTERLADFSLTPQEWTEYQQREAPVVDWKFIRPFENFYRIADKRSEGMINQLIARSPSSGFIVLVAGGFHTPRMTQVLKAKGIPYAVIQPKITKILDVSGSAYLSIFTREKTPLEKLFQGEKLFLAPAETALGSYSPHTQTNEMGTLAMFEVGHRLKDEKVPLQTGLQIIQEDTRTFLTSLRHRRSLSYTIFERVPSGFSVLEQGATPFGVEIRYLEKTPMELISLGRIRRGAKHLIKSSLMTPWREVWFPIFSVVPLFTFSIASFAFPGMTPLFFGVNAVVFAALRGHWEEGRFHWRHFAGKALGAFSILLTSGILAGGEMQSVDHVFQFIVFTIIGHGLWNLACTILGQRWPLFLKWQLVLSKGPRKRVSREESLFLEKMRHRGVADIDLANGVLSQVRGFKGAFSSNGRITPPLIMAVQEYELNALGRRLGDYQGEANPEDVQKEARTTQSRLKKLFDIYNEAVGPNGLMLVLARIKIPLATMTPIKLLVITSKEKVDAEKSWRATAEVRQAIAQAVQARQRITDDMVAAMPEGERKAAGEKQIQAAYGFSKSPGVPFQERIDALEEALRRLSYDFPGASEGRNKLETQLNALRVEKARKEQAERAAAAARQVVLEINALLKSGSPDTEKVNGLKPLIDLLPPDHPQRPQAQGILQKLEARVQGIAAARQAVEQAVQENRRITDAMVDALPEGEREAVRRSQAKAAYALSRNPEVSLEERIEALAEAIPHLNEGSEARRKAEERLTALRAEKDRKDQAERAAQAARQAVEQAVQENRRITDAMVDALPEGEQRNQARQKQVQMAFQLSKNPDTPLKERIDALAEAIPHIKEGTDGRIKAERRLNELREQEEKLKQTSRERQFLAAEIERAKITVNEEVLSTAEAIVAIIRRIKSSLPLKLSLTPAMVMAIQQYEIKAFLRRLGGREGKAPPEDIEKERLTTQTRLERLFKVFPEAVRARYGMTPETVELPLNLPATVEMRIITSRVEFMARRGSALKEIRSATKSDQISEALISLLTHEDGTPHVTAQKRARQIRDDLKTAEDAKKSAAIPDELIARLPNKEAQRLAEEKRARARKAEQEANALTAFPIIFVRQEKLVVIDDGYGQWRVAGQLRPLSFMIGGLQALISVENQPFILQAAASTTFKLAIAGTGGKISNVSSVQVVVQQGRIILQQVTLLNGKTYTSDQLTQSAQNTVRPSKSGQPRAAAATPRAPPFEHRAAPSAPPPANSPAVPPSLPPPPSTVADSQPKNPLEVFQRALQELREELDSFGGWRILDGFARELQSAQRMNLLKVVADVMSTVEPMLHSKKLTTPREVIRAGAEILDDYANKIEQETAHGGKDRGMNDLKVIATAASAVEPLLNNEKLPPGCQGTIQKFIRVGRKFVRDQYSRALNVVIAALESKPIDGETEYQAFGTLTEKLELMKRYNQTGDLLGVSFVAEEIRDEIKTRELARVLDRLIQVSRLATPETRKPWFPLIRRFALGALLYIWGVPAVLTLVSVAVGAYYGVPLPFDALGWLAHLGGLVYVVYATHRGGFLGPRPSAPESTEQNPSWKRWVFWGFILVATLLAAYCLTYFCFRLPFQPVQGTGNTTYLASLPLMLIWPARKKLSDAVTPPALKKPKREGKISARLLLVLCLILPLSIFALINMRPGTGPIPEPPGISKTEKGLDELLKKPPLPDIGIRKKGGAYWVEDAEELLSARWSLQDAQRRINAIKTATNRRVPMEIPEIPLDETGSQIELVDKDGRPLPARDVKANEIFFKAVDGEGRAGVIDSRNPDHCVFDPKSRTFTPLRGWALVKSSLYRPQNFRGTDGRLLPKDGYRRSDAAKETVFWRRLRDGAILRVHPGEPAVSVDPQTGLNEIIFPDRAALAAKNAQLAALDLALAYNRIALGKALLSGIPPGGEPGRVYAAFEIDKSYGIVKCYPTKEDLHKDIIYVDHKGKERDMWLSEDERPQKIIRRIFGPKGALVDEHEIVFTHVKVAPGEAAQRAKQARNETLGAWATTTLPSSLTDLGAWHLSLVDVRAALANNEWQAALGRFNFNSQVFPAYMLAEVDGQIQSWPTPQVAVDQLIRHGVKGTTIAELTGSGGPSAAEQLSKQLAAIDRDQKIALMQAHFEARQKIVPAESARRRTLALAQMPGASVPVMAIRAHLAQQLQAEQLAIQQALLKLQTGTVDARRKAAQNQFESLVAEVKEAQRQLLEGKDLAARPEFESCDALKIYTHDSASFEKIWMRWYSQNGARMAWGVRTDAKLEKRIELKGTGLDKDEQAKLARGLQGQVVWVFEPTLDAVAEKDLTIPEALALGVYGAVPLDDGTWIVRVAYGEGKGDRMIYHRLPAGAKTLNDGMPIKAPGSADRAEKAVAFQLPDGTQIVRLGFGYKMDAQGSVVQLYVDSAELLNDLQRLDLSFDLSDGRKRVPLGDAHLENMAERGVSVVATYDKLAYRIVVGSEWERMQYVMKQSVRLSDQLMNPPALAFSTPAGAFLPPPGLPPLLQAQLYLEAHVSWRIYLAVLRANIAAQSEPAARNKAVENYLRAQKSLSFPGVQLAVQKLEINAAGDKAAIARLLKCNVIIKGTSYERYIQSLRELYGLSRTLQAEALRGSSFGGEFVVPGGPILEEIRLLQEEQERLKDRVIEIRGDKELKEKDKRDAIRDIRKEWQRLSKDIEKAYGRWAKEVVKDKKFAPGQAELFKTEDDYKKACNAQKAYITALDADRRAALPAGRFAEAADLKRRIEIASQTFSYVGDAGQTRYITPSWQIAQREAEKRALQDHRDRRLAEIEQMIREDLGPFAVRRETVRRPNGEVTITHFAQTLDAHQALKQIYEGAPAKGGLGKRVEGAYEKMQFVNPPLGDGTLITNEWFIVRGGGALHLIEKGGKLFTVIEPGELVDQALDYFLRPIKKAADVAAARARGDLQEGPDGGGIRVFSYTVKGTRHTWIPIHSLEKAKKSRVRLEVERDQADVLDSRRQTVVHEIGKDGTARLITEKREVDGIVQEIARRKYELMKRYQWLQDKNGEEALGIARQWRRLNGNWYEDDHGRTYVVQFSLSDAMDYYQKLLRKFSDSHTDQEKRVYTCYDTNQMPLGALIQTRGEKDGESTYLFKEVLFRETDPKTGRASIEIKTYCSGSELPGSQEKGVLMRVTREWVDTKQDTLAEISGELWPKGRFEPRRITINRNKDDDGIFRDSQTYEYRGDAVSLDDYKAGDPNIGSSRVLHVEKDGAGRVLWIQYERINELGAYWQEFKSKGGRLLTVIEGDRVDGRFVPLRFRAPHYEHGAYAAVGISSRSNVFRYQADHVARWLQKGEEPGRRARVGWSRVTTPFLNYRALGEVEYEQWDPIKQEMVREVKNRDGRLIRHYTIRSQGDGFIPYNVTLFIYKGPHERLGVPDTSYTFRTDENGMILGEDGKVYGHPRAVNPEDPRTPYFNYSLIDEIREPREPGGSKKVAYRIMVRYVSISTYELFGEVKDASGRIESRQVVHPLGQRDVPEEITLNGNFTPEGPARWSRTYFVYYPRDAGAPAKKLDPSSLPIGPGGKDIIDLRDTHGCVLVLKDEASLLSLQDGSLKYRRWVYGYAPDGDGGWRRVVHSTYIDTIHQDFWHSLFNERTSQDFRADYDDFRIVAKGQVTDHSHHPSMEGGGAAAVVERVKRIDKGIMKNPHLPDWPARYWEVYDVEHLSRAGETIYTGKRWVLVSGNKVVEVRRTKRPDGEPQDQVVLFLSDRDGIEPVYAIPPSQDVAVLPLAAALGRQTPVDVSDSHFLYFYVEGSSIAGPAPGTTFSVTFWDAHGKSVVVGPRRLVQKSTALQGVRGIEISSDSCFQGKQMLWVIPVKELGHAGLDLATLQPRIQVRVHRPQGQPEGTIRLSPVQRVGQVSKTESLSFQDPAVPKEHPERAPDLSFVLSSPSGQEIVFDATRGSKAGLTAEILGADHQKLGAIRVYMSGIERSGKPMEQRRLILYDRSGRYTIASVGLRRGEDGRWVVDRSDVILVSNREKGKILWVYGQDPVTNPHYPIATPYDQGSSGFDRPTGGAEIGTFGRLDTPSSELPEDPREIIRDRVNNSPYSLVIRKGTTSNPVPTTFATERDIDEALAAINPDSILQGNYKLDQLPQRLAGEPPASPFAWHKFLYPFDHDNWMSYLWLGLFLWPAWLFIYSCRCGRRWNAWRAKIQWKRDWKSDQKLDLRDPSGRRWGEVSRTEADLSGGKKRRLTLYDEDGVEIAGVDVVLRKGQWVLDRAVRVARATDADAATRLLRYLDIDREIRNARFKLFHEDLVLQAFTRISEKVAGKQVRLNEDGRPIIVSEGNIEGAFLANLFTIYQLAFSWVRQAGLSDAEAEAHLTKLDEFAKAVWKFTSVKIAQGSADPKKARYVTTGQTNVQIWATMEIYLSTLRDSLKEALDHDLDLKRLWEDWGSDPSGEKEENFRLLTGANPGEFAADDPRLNPTGTASLFQFNSRLDDMYRSTLESLDEAKSRLDDEYEERKAWDGASRWPKLDSKLAARKAELDKIYGRDAFLFNEDGFNHFIKKGRFDYVPAFFTIAGRYLVKCLPIVLGLLIFKGPPLVALGGVFSGALPILLVLGAAGLLMNLFRLRRSSTKGLRFVVPFLTLPLAGLLIYCRSQTFLDAFILLALALTLSINAFTEAGAIRGARSTPALAGRLRAILPLLAVVGLFYLYGTTQGTTVSDLIFLTFFAGTLLVESLGIGVRNRSLIGVTWWYHARPPHDKGRNRSVLLLAITHTVFILLGLFFGSFAMSWFIDWFAMAGQAWRVAPAFVLFLVYGGFQLHQGVNLGVRFMFSALSPSRGPGRKPEASRREGGTIFTGGNSLAADHLTEKTKKITDIDELIKTLEKILSRPDTDPLRHEIVGRLGATAADTPDDIKARVKEWLTKLINAENAANGGKGCALSSPSQIVVSATPPTSLTPLQIVVASDADRDAIEQGWRIRQVLNGYSEVQDYVDAFMISLYHHSLTGRRTARLWLVEEGIDANALDNNAVRRAVEERLEAVCVAELRADGGKGTTLWNVARQMYDPRIDDSLKVGQGLPEERCKLIESGFNIRWRIAQLFGPRFTSLNTAFNWVGAKEAEAALGLTSLLTDWIMSNQFNNYDNPALSPQNADINNRTELGQRAKLAQLMEYVSGAKVYVVHNKTVFGMKSGAMNGVFLTPDELVSLKWFRVDDRQVETSDLDQRIQDTLRMMENPELAVIVSFRNVTYVLDPIAGTGFAIEGGHGVSMESNPDKIGTGWAERVQNPFPEVMRELADPDAPFRSFINGKSDDPMSQLFGIIPFAPNSPHPSEDHANVLGTYYTLVSLGTKPELGLSWAIAHKMRERLYGEWTQAPPRWSSGLVNVMNDLLLQQMSEFGPESIFEKEARQTNGDHYLLGLFILQTAILLPISIIWGFSPFVGVDFLLFCLGLFINQISTTNSLLANWRHKGFWVGTAAWLETRPMDSLLFSARTVRDALAQITGHRGISFEFTPSGGGVDNPWKVIWEGFEPKRPFLSLCDAVFGTKFVIERKPEDPKTVWGAIFRDLLKLKEPHTFLNTFTFGLLLVGINVCAIWVGLDSTNIFMMILSLWFAAGVAFGPLIKDAKKGWMVADGIGDLLAKIAGWALGFGTMLLGAHVLNTSLSPMFDAVPLPLILIADAVIIMTMLALISLFFVHRYNAYDGKKPRLIRLSSEAHRGFWMYVVLFGWFLLAPVHPVLRLTFLSHPFVVIPIDLAIGAAVVVGVVMGIILLGKIVSHLESEGARWGRFLWLPRVRGGLIWVPVIAVALWFIGFNITGLLTFAAILIVSGWIGLFPCWVLKKSVEAAESAYENALRNHGRDSPEAKTSSRSFARLRRWSNILNVLFPPVLSFVNFPKEKSFNERYLKLSARFKPLSNDLDFAKHAKIDNLLMEASGIFLQQEAYRYAQLSLDKVEILIRALELRKRYATLNTRFEELEGLGTVPDDALDPMADYLKKIDESYKKQAYDNMEPRLRKVEHLIQVWEAVEELRRLREAYSTDVSQPEFLRMTNLLRDSAKSMNGGLAEVILYLNDRKIALEGTGYPGAQGRASSTFSFSFEPLSFTLLTTFLIWAMWEEPLFFGVLGALAGLVAYFSRAQSTFSSARGSPREAHPPISKREIPLSDSAEEQEAQTLAPLIQRIQLARAGGDHHGVALGIEELVELQQSLGVREFGLIEDALARKEVEPVIDGFYIKRHRSEYRTLDRRPEAVLDQKVSTVLIPKVASLEDVSKEVGKEMGTAPRNWNFTILLVKANEVHFDLLKHTFHGIRFARETDLTTPDQVERDLFGWMTLDSRSSVRVVAHKGVILTKEFQESLNVLSRNEEIKKLVLFIILDFLSDTNESIQMKLDDFNNMNAFRQRVLYLSQA